MQLREKSVEFCLRLMSAALKILQIENENILKVFAAEMWLTYTRFDDQKNSNDIDIVNQEYLGEASVGSLGLYWHCKSSWHQCHVFQEHEPACDSKIGWVLHFWKLH